MNASHEARELDKHARLYLDKGEPIEQVVKMLRYAARNRGLSDQDFEEYLASRENETGTVLLMPATYVDPEPDYDDASAPPVCPLASDRGHVRDQCPRCLARALWAREQAQEWKDARDAADVVDETIYGDMLEALPPTRILFGIGQQIVSAVGQPWGIFGPDGTGKSTIGEHYSKGRLGIPGWTDMWGMPITPLPEDRTVLYLALDRAVQIMEGMKRGLDFTADADRLRRLLIKKQVMANLASEAGQRWMLEEVEKHSVGLVVVDSRKDIGGTLNADSIEGINALFRALSNDEVEVLILGHTREGRRPNGVGPSIEDPSGFREVVSGLGSVIVLEGRPGAPTTQVHHVKPIHELVAPFTVQNDHQTGRGLVLGALVAAGGGGAAGGQRFAITGGAQPMTGTVPVNATQNKALAFIAANAVADPAGWVPSSVLMSALNLTKLDRAFKEMKEAGIVEHNGKTGPQSAWRRGPNAPKA